MGLFAPARVAITRTLTILLALGGCRDQGVVDEDPGEGSSSSGGSGVGLDDTGSLPTFCEPDQVRPCYEGPFGTADIGVCRSGQQTCAADGSQWSACEGEVWPQPQERCDTPQDDDCDGSTLCRPTLEWIEPLPGYVQRIRATLEGGAIAWGYGYGATDELVLDDTFLLAVSPEGQPQWVRNVGGTDLAEATGLHVDDQGRVTMAGRYNGDPNFGGGPLPSSQGYDAFVVRFASDGEHLWSHGLSPSGYKAMTVGPDGTTYVGGDTISISFQGELRTGNFFLAAIDPDGALQWVTTGSGGAMPPGEWLDLAVTEQGELVVLAVFDDFGSLELGGMPLVTGGPEPVLVRLTTDGIPLDYRRLSEESTNLSGRLFLHARPGGVMTASAAVQSPEQSGFGFFVRLAGFDAALEPQTEKYIGFDVLTRAAESYPLGGTLLTLEFGGQLQLGTLGITPPSYPPGQAVAVVDDQGQASWAVMLYTSEYAEIFAAASAPDGSVVLGADAAGQSTLAGENVEGTFIAKLRL